MKLFVVTRNVTISFTDGGCNSNHLIGVFKTKEEAEKGADHFNKEILKDENELDKIELQEAYKDLIEITEVESNKVYTDLELLNELI